MWDKAVRKKVLKERSIPETIIEQFEAECPESVIKMDPLKRNSPKLYDLKAFDAWWNKRIKTQVQAQRRMRRLGGMT